MSKHTKPTAGAAIELNAVTYRVVSVTDHPTGHASTVKLTANGGTYRMTWVHDPSDPTRGEFRGFRVKL